MDVVYNGLNSSLMMSLGAGALKVSGGPNAISREEVSMATLEAGTTQRNPSPGAWRTERPVNRVTWYLRSPKQIPKHQTTPTAAQITKALTYNFVADPQAEIGKRSWTRTDGCQASYPGKQWGLCTDGILHGTVERAEASFCENAASKSASVLIQSW